MATNPMHQFEVYRIGPKINFGQIDVSFTNSSLFMMISTLSIFAILFLGTKKKYLIPSKIQLLSEMIYIFVAGILVHTFLCFGCLGASNLHIDLVFIIFYHCGVSPIGAGAPQGTGPWGQGHISKVNVFCICKSYFFYSCYKYGSRFFHGIFSGSI